MSQSSALLGLVYLNVSSLNASLCYDSSRSVLSSYIYTYPEKLYEYHKVFSIFCFGLCCWQVFFAFFFCLCVAGVTVVADMKVYIYI